MLETIVIKFSLNTNRYIDNARGEENFSKVNISKRIKENFCEGFTRFEFQNWNFLKLVIWFLFSRARTPRMSNKSKRFRDAVSRMALINFRKLKKKRFNIDSGLTRSAKG